MTRMKHSPPDVDAATPYVQVPRRTRARRAATSTVVASLGVLASLVAVEHGVGEVLQGRGVPESLVIESWPNSPAFSA